MQLASHGPRGLPRVSNLPAGKTSRSIHIPAYVRVKPTAPPNFSSSSQRIFSQTRAFITRFIGHLTAPGIQLSHASSLPHTVRTGAPGRMSTIQQRLSNPVRHALARPSLHLPYAPTFASRSVAQVGLGTARNFHSGRSVFQNLVQNVPVTGRAFYETDWDMKIKRDRAAMKKVMSEGKKKSRRGEMLKAKNQISAVALPAIADSAEVSTQEMDRYFTAPITPDVVTYLLIPLAPTPTSRVPLDPNGGSARHPLLPLSSLASMHNSHEMHALRVSSLFSRLDAANVWERGVVCSSYASHADKDGVCTILKIEFTGWTVAEVRGVIGEAGTGWCVLEEEHTQRVVEDDDDLSDASSILSGISGPLSVPEGSPLSPESVSDSFVLPTLDFSSSFPDSHESPVLSRTSSASDLFSEISMEVDDPWLGVEVSDSDSGSRLRFSYDFARRSDLDLEDRYRPM
ncbi:hypothetical protein L218DRAFT_956820 [Marasmius fiardii PR-910]|nr:hypothetical protein L218DRAFT_956820 [Marasmius fiardii PR-910]